MSQGPKMMLRPSVSLGIIVESSIVEFYRIHMQYKKVKKFGKSIVQVPDTGTSQYW